MRIFYEGYNKRNRKRGRNGDRFRRKYLWEMMVMWFLLYTVGFIEDL